MFAKWQFGVFSTQEKIFEKSHVFRSQKGSTKRQKKTHTNNFCVFMTGKNCDVTKSLYNNSLMSYQLTCSRHAFILRSQLFLTFWYLLSSQYDPRLKKQLCSR